MTLKESKNTQQQKLINISYELENYTIALRRALHKIPELGWKEAKTIKKLKEEIASIQKTSHKSLEVKEVDGGLWVDLTVDVNRPRILLRADIDALPIQEKTNLEFSSEHPGKMHACGHDCHAAMLMGALKALATDIEPYYNIRFVWQRAEEFAECKSGGKTLVDNGVCAGIEKCYGLHIFSTMTNGILGSRPENFMANATTLEISVQCTGGHIMHPHMGSSAVDILVDIQNSLRGFEKIYFSPLENLVFSPATMHAGTAANIRPCDGYLTFSLRNFLSTEKRDLFIQAVKARIESVISGYDDAKLSNFSFHAGYPPVYNDSYTYQETEAKLTKIGLDTQEIAPLFCGEDFAYISQKVPGVFYGLGAKQGPGWDHHTPFFNPDESVLKKGILYWLAIACA